MSYSEKDLKETSTPDLFLPMLQAKREELLTIIDGKRKALMRAPQGRLRIAINRGSPQWFHVGENASPKGTCLATSEQKVSLLSGAVQRGTYLPQTEEKLARRLAQKSYDEKVLDAARKSLAAIEVFLNAYEKNSVNEVAGKMHEARQTLLRPVMLSNQVLAARWLVVPYAGKDVAEGTAVSRSARLCAKGGAKIERIGRMRVLGVTKLLKNARF